MTIASALRRACAGLAVFVLSGSAALAALPTPFATVPFSDVPSTHANFEAIEYLRKNNVIRGYLDGTFKPERQITRSEFAQMLTNPFIFKASWKSGCVPEKINPAMDKVFFPDIARDSWYAEAVCTAYVYELIRGYPDGFFRPLRPINFVEAAKIATRVFSLDVAEEPGEQWYAPYVQRLDALNAIPMTIKRLDQQITRGEMAEIVFRLKTANDDKPSKTFEELM
jgi:hypothetical protein